MNPLTAASYWVFGLSLDETIEWRLQRAIRQGRRWVFSDDPADKICPLVPFTMPDAKKYEDNLQGRLRAGIEAFVAKVPEEIVKDVHAAGVSLVGEADREHLQLVNVARMAWGTPATPVVDFRALFEGLFPTIEVGPEIPRPRINIHNESTAKCLAEWTAGGFGDPISSLLYVMFSDGVNAGFVSEGQHLPTGLHTELGHVWPRPHRIDLNFDTSLRGCRVHSHCFEALCSATRIRGQWAKGRDKPLHKLSREARDVMAYYIAQMCMNGVLAFSPKRILLGGRTPFEGLIPLIIEYFSRFNGGRTGSGYLSYDDMNDDHFISLASIPAEVAGIKAALELARRVLEHDPTALRVLGKPEFIEVSIHDRSRKTCASVQ